MLIAPVPEVLGVLFRHEVRAYALVSFADHAGDVIGFDAEVGESFFKQIEAGIRN